MRLQSVTVTFKISYCWNKTCSKIHCWVDHTH